VKRTNLISQRNIS